MTSSIKRTVLTVLVFLVALVWGAIGLAANGVTPSTPGTVAVVADPVAAVECQEDDPCWNACTMGVNGHYDASDPRHLTPGPCNAGTTLPHGYRFHTIAGESTMLDCGPGQHAVLLLVRVTGPTGDVPAQASVDYCVALEADPIAAAGDDVRATLYRLAGQAFDRQQGTPVTTPQVPVSPTVEKSAPVTAPVSTPDTGRGKSTPDRKRTTSPAVTAPVVTSPTAPITIPAAPPVVTCDDWTGVCSDGTVTRVCYEDGSCNDGTCKGQGWDCAKPDVTTTTAPPVTTTTTAVPTTTGTTSTTDASTTDPTSPTSPTV